MKYPGVSVIMPVYNAGKYLLLSIESILNQNYTDFEFIIINDASTDDSKKIIQSFSDPRIYYHENHVNLGVARSLNIGLKMAKGKYVARMDADDISLPNRLQIQYDVIVNNNYPIIASYYEEIDAHGKSLGKNKGPTTSEEIYYQLYFKNCIAHPTVMFNRLIILEKFKGYDEKHEAEDYDLWLRVIHKYKIASIGKILLMLRLTNNSRMGFFKSKIDKDAMSLMKSNLKTLFVQPIDTGSIKVLTGYYSIDLKPVKITKALLLLNDINDRIMKDPPDFLKRDMLQKAAWKKVLQLKIKLIFSVLAHSGAGYIFKQIYLIFYLIKKNI